MFCASISARLQIHVPAWKRFLDKAANRWIKLKAHHSIRASRRIPLWEPIGSHCTRLRRPLQCTYIRLAGEMHENKPSTWSKEWTKNYSQATTGGHHRDDAENKRFARGQKRKTVRGGAYASMVNNGELTKNTRVCDHAERSRFLPRLRHRRYM